MPVGGPLAKTVMRCCWLAGGFLSSAASQDCQSSLSPFSTATSGWQPSYTTSARPWAFFTCMPFTSVMGDGGGETSRAVHRVARFNSVTHNSRQDVTTIPSSPHRARMPEQMAGLVAHVFPRVSDCQGGAVWQPPCRIACLLLPLVQCATTGAPASLSWPPFLNAASVHAFCLRECASSL